MERSEVILQKLLKTIPCQMIKGSKQVEITGITANSKLVAPGFLFLAKKGLTVDGARFIPEAVAAGAAAVVTDLYNPFLSITQVIHPDPSSIEGVLAEAFYNRPVDSLFLVGITGTNGKTTTSYLIKHLLQEADAPCGLIGTVQGVIGSHVFPSNLTTPDSIS